jgi:hypothetical protein
MFANMDSIDLAQEMDKWGGLFRTQERTLGFQ